jgi:hypothetical protein
VIVAVTGGRDVLPTNVERAALLRLLDVLPCTTLRHGRASGVDGAVARLLRNRPSAILVEAWPARWRDAAGELDLSAGPRRNAAMLLGDTRSPAVEWARSDIPERPRVDVLVAWPGGRGTAACVLVAKRHGIQVVHIGELVERMRGAS